MVLGDRRIKVGKIEVSKECICYILNQELGKKILCYQGNVLSHILELPRAKIQELRFERLDYVALSIGSSTKQLLSVPSAKNCTWTSEVFDK